MLEMSLLILSMYRNLSKKIEPIRQDRRDIVWHRKFSHGSHRPIWHKPPLSCGSHEDGTCSSSQ